jgi:hypothetical protein
MRKFYLTFPKSETLSHQLTWSHYFELLKCDDPMEMQFYMKECIKEGWKVRELKRQINSSLFQRLALSTDKEGVLALANEGHQIQSATDIIRDPYILEFTGLPRQKRYKYDTLSAYQCLHDCLLCIDGLSDGIDDSQRGTETRCSITQKLHKYEETTVA